MARAMKPRKGKYRPRHSTSFRPFPVNFAYDRPSRPYPQMQRTIMGLSDLMDLREKIRA